MPRRSSRPVILRWMPTPRLSEARRAVPAAAIVLATMLLVVGFGVGGSDERSLVSQASGWRGLVGGPPSSLTLRPREIVVLQTPPLPQRAAPNGGLLSVPFPGYAGRGVTIALPDTGVDRAHPYLRGRTPPGVNLVDPEVRGGAAAVADPDEPSRLEGHGTEMAGLLVGAGGPGGIAGVATGASLLPIRVAGWQLDKTGGWAVYAPTHQLGARLQR